MAAGGSHGAATVVRGISRRHRRFYRTNFGFFDLECVGDGCFERVDECDREGVRVRVGDTECVIECDREGVRDGERVADRVGDECFELVVVRVPLMELLSVVLRVADIVGVCAMGGAHIMRIL